MIINSLLDIDFYKLTMMQLAFYKHRDVKVKFEFTNRTKDINLLEHIPLDVLIREFNHVTKLKFTEDEINYLDGIKINNSKIFKQEFIEYLRDFNLPELTVYRAMPLSKYEISVEGNWCEVTLWETIILSIVNELYHKSCTNPNDIEEIYNNGLNRLWGKINKLVGGKYTFTEFGTRRRWSREWQELVVNLLFNLEKQIPGGIGFKGTSNVYLSKKLGIIPIGTFAHEMDMVYSGIYNHDLKLSHRLMLKDWYDFYGNTLSIALTDTYGSKYFFEDFTNGQAIEWNGLRQDSGDPFKFGEDTIKFYINKMVNPIEKVIVFSDGLDIDKIIGLGETFKGRIKTMFGWGSNLVCDLGYNKNISIVVKVTKSNGNGTVKLSDNLNKAMGNPEDVERFKTEFGYTNKNNEELKN